YALHQKLPDDAPSRRADRHPDGDLARAMRGARQQQVGYIRTGNEQHERDSAHERPENCFDTAADDTFQKWSDRGCNVLIAVLILLRELTGNVRHLAA